MENKKYSEDYLKKRDKREEYLETAQFVAKLFAFFCSIPLLISLLGFLMCGIYFFNVNTDIERLEQLKYCSSCGYDLLEEKI